MPVPAPGGRAGRESTMLILSTSQTHRLWERAAHAWTHTGPAAAWDVFRSAGAESLWPTFRATALARARRQYLSRMESVSEPHRAKIGDGGRSQYPPARIGALRRSGTRQSGMPGRQARKVRHAIQDR